MKFYIGNPFQEVKVENQPKLSLAKDSTNDSFTCVLKANHNENPYAPMTPFKIEFDDETTKIMWVISDNVSIFSTKPLMYKHSLNVVQYRYFLNKHIIRNTVFSQPREKNVKIFGSVSSHLYSEGSGSSFRVYYSSCAKNSNLDADWWSDVYVLNAHSRVDKLKVKKTLYGVKNYKSGVSPTIEKIKNVYSRDNADIRDNAHFYLIDSLNNNYRIAYFNFSSFEDEFIIDDSYKNTLNSYIESRNGAPIQLELEYGSGYISSTVPHQVETSFARTINQTVTEDFDPEDDTTYSFLTVQFTIELELYNYKLYDVIKTLLDQYQLWSLEYGVQPRRPKLFDLPTQESNPELYNLLKTTNAPDILSFTESTFYEALEQVFRIFDAGFRFRPNGEIDIEYYNDKTTLINPKLTGVNINHASKNYCNGRINHYQNAVVPIEMKNIKVRSNTLGVPAKSDYGIILPKPIYNVENLALRVYGQCTLVTLGFAGGSIYATTDGMFLDLTPFVVSKDIWTNLDAGESFGNNETREFRQINTIPYERGSNFICVSDYYSSFLSQTKAVLTNVKKYAFYRFFGVGHLYDGRWSSFESPGDSDWANCTFNITYMASNNGLIRTETLKGQYLGEILTEQSDGLVDLEKLGLSMFSESLRDGVPSLTASCEIRPWGKKVNEGDYIIRDGEIWIVSFVEYTILPNGNQKCDVTFTKNFNMTSLRIKSDNEKRLTNISRSQAVMSEDAYIDYIYISDNATYTSNRSNISLDHSFVESALNTTFAIENDATQSLYNTITFGGFSDSLSGDKIYIPVMKYSAGNCVCYEFQFEDPINAGNQLIKETGWFGSNSYFSKAIKYTDDEGWADEIYLKLYRPVDENFAIDDFPILDANDLRVIGTISLKYYLKPNEIFGLNYEVCFLPHPAESNKFFIGTTFIEESGFVKKVGIDKTFYLYYTTPDSSFEYSILDKKGEGEHLSITLSSDVVDSCPMLTITPTSIPSGVTKFKTWALCDIDGNIYFASNKERDADEINIYFITRQTRLI